MDSQTTTGLDTAVSTPTNQTKINNPIIELRDVTKVYHTGSGDFTALKDINLKIGYGEFFGIIGKSGAGKTTLLNMISGVSEITERRSALSPHGTLARLSPLADSPKIIWPYGAVRIWELFTNPLSCFPMSIWSPIS